MRGIRVMGKKYMKYSKCGIYYGYLVAETSSSLGSISQIIFIKIQISMNIRTLVLSKEICVSRLKKQILEVVYLFVNRKNS